MRPQTASWLRATVFVVRSTKPTLIGSRAASRHALELRIHVRAASVDEFLDRYGSFVEDDRIFIVTRVEQPVGTRLRFTLHLASGVPVLSGRGVVERLSDIGERPGMQLLFDPVGDDSVRLLERLRERRVHQPVATDASAAPRFSDDWAPLPELVPENSEP